VEDFIHETTSLRFRGLGPAIGALAVAVFGVGFLTMVFATASWDQTVRIWNVKWNMFSLAKRE
jgi:hypothetical protein